MASRNQEVAQINDPTTPASWTAALNNPYSLPSKLFNAALIKACLRDYFLEKAIQEWQRVSLTTEKKEKEELAHAAWQRYEADEKRLISETEKKQKTIRQTTVPDNLTELTKYFSALDHEIIKKTQEVEAINARVKDTQQQVAHITEAFRAVQASQMNRFGEELRNQNIHFMTSDGNTLSTQDIIRCLPAPTPCMVRLENNPVMADHIQHLRQEADDPVAVLHTVLHRDTLLEEIHLFSMLSGGVLKPSLIKRNRPLAKAFDDVAAMVHEEKLGLLERNVELRAALNVDQKKLGSKQDELSHLNHLRESAVANHFKRTGKNEGYKIPPPPPPPRFDR